MTEDPLPSARPWRRVIAIVGVLVVATALAAVALVFTPIANLERIASYRPALPTRVYDRHGVEIGAFAEQQRQLVRLADVPPHVVSAFLAAEDADFYQHRGLDVVALARAAWVNFRAGAIRQGGSTITQQLAKSLLPPGRTMGRKLRDMLLAIQIESRFTKDEILEIYLNEIYLGNGAYGVAQAARSYFGKDLGALTLSEAAQIAGLTKAPSASSPNVDPAAAEERRRYVLDRIEALGYADPATVQAARDATPRFIRVDPPQVEPDAAYFVEDVRRMLQQRLGGEVLLRGGYRVETTLDLGLQRTATAALRRGVESMERRRKKRADDEPQSPVEGAFVALDVASGDVLALVGGYDFARSEFDRATQARRQPGSAFKTFVYGAALEAGFRPDSTLYDVQVELRDRKTGRRWTPRNAAGELRGPVPMHEALARSLNNASVRLAIDVGVPKVVDFARRAGIEAPLAEDLGLALGASGVSPLELTSAFATVAGGGMRRPPRFVARVVDRDGAVVVADLGLDGGDAPAHPVRAFSEVDAYLLTHLLRGPVRSGYGTAHAAASLGPALAGKTGSTNDNRDAWFVGFSPEIAAGVWIGDDAMTPLGPQAMGSRAALPIWIEFMKTALATRADDAEPPTFAMPDGVRMAGAQPYAVGRPAVRARFAGVAKPAPKLSGALADAMPGPLRPTGAGLRVLFGDEARLPSVGAGPLRQ